MIKPDWDLFYTILLKNKIPQNQHHYYIKRIEQLLLFIQNDCSYRKEYDGDTDDLITPEFISHFLQDIDRKFELSSWQFRQLLHALKLFLISLYHFTWAKEFDWGYWQDAAQKLPDNHATVVRDYIELPTNQQPAVNPITSSQQTLLDKLNLCATGRELCH